MKVRFFGFSSPINGDPVEWDYVESFETEEEAAEAVESYICQYDSPESSLAFYEIQEL